MSRLSDDRAVAVLRNLIGAVFTAGVLSLIWPQSLHGTVAFIGVDGHSMDGTYVDGDLVVARRQARYDVGDVITYRIPAGEFGAGARVIHRIIGGDGRTGFVTQGDNRTIADPWRPRDADVVGESWLRLPGGSGIFLQLAQPMNLGALCAALTVFVMLLPKREKPATSAAGSVLLAPR